MSKNDTSSPPEQEAAKGTQGGTSLITSLLNWAGNRFSALMLLLAVLLALFHLAVNFLLAPAAQRVLSHASAKLSADLGLEVEVGFSDLDLTFGLNGANLTATAAFLRLGEQEFTADEAVLAVYPNEPPVLHVSGLEISVVQRQDGSLVMDQIALGGQDGASDGMVNLLPIDLIVSDMDLKFTSMNGDVYALQDLELAMHANVETNQLQISFRNPFSSWSQFQGRVDVGVAPLRADVYLKITNPGSKLALLPPPLSDLSAASMILEFWGSYEDDLLHGLTAKASASQLRIDDDAIAPLVARRVQWLGKIDAPVAPILGSPFTLHWSAKVGGFATDPGEPVLGSELKLESIEASGMFDRDANGWQLAIPELRFAGEVGVGGLEVDLGHAAGEKQPHVNVRGSMPQVNVGKVFELLPVALSERGVPMLRQDLNSRSAQATALIIRGSDFSSFPWPDREDGEFRLDIDFFETDFDYADGYPPLVGGSGAISLRGSSLAIEVAAATTGPAQIKSAKAGVDDLNAVESTLYVAASAGLGDGDLFSLLRTLPDTRSAAEAQLPELELSGSQDLELRVVVPLDTDDPVEIGGTLTAGAGNEITYLPQQLTVSEFEGDFNFDDSGVHGIGYGVLLGAGARISLAIEDGEPELVVDGTYDLAETMSLLGLAEDLPLRGKSQVTATLKNKVAELHTNLTGTAVELPKPLGKTAAERRELRARIDATGAELDYAGGLARIVSGAAGGLAISFNEEAPPVNTGPGTKISGQIAGIDLDSIALGSAGGGIDLPLPVVADLHLPLANMLGTIHPELRVQATLQSTVTVAMLSSKVIEGSVELANDLPVQVSLSYLHMPENEGQEIDPDALTVYVEPGELTPALPAMQLQIDDLLIGSRNYFNLNAAGRPQGDYWILDSLTAHTKGANTIHISGRSATAGEPQTEVTLSVAIGDLEQFIDNYTDAESIIGGRGGLTGNLSWQGAINKVNDLSLEGSMDIRAEDFILKRESGGVRLLNLLSPFTLLEGIQDLPDEGFALDADGEISFSEGLLNVDRMHMSSNSVDIKMAGSTNLITKRNDLNSVVELKNTQDITTTAVAAINPMAGAFLLVFDKIIDQPLLGDLNLRLNYSITGTWDDPVVEQKQETGDGG